MRTRVTRLAITLTAAVSIAALAGTPAAAVWIPNVSGRPAGTAVDWLTGTDGPDRPPEAVNDLVSVAVAERSALGLRANGSVVTWADPFSTGTPAPVLRDGVAISAGPGTAAVLRQNGSVTSWGFHAPATQDLGADNLAVAAGSAFVVALKADHTVAVVGRNSAGQADVPVGLSDVVAVAAGGFRGTSDWPCGFALALRSDGEVVRWGGRTEVGGCGEAYDHWTPEPRKQRLVAISAGSDFAVGVRPNGTVVAWGNLTSPALRVPSGLRNVVSVAAGADQVVALRSDGSVVSWGSERYPSPPSDLRAYAVAVSYGHQIALTTPVGVGSPVLQTRVDTNPAGRAEAFRFVAARSGPANRMRFHVDSSNQADDVLLGLYSDVDGHPGVLLASNGVGAPSPGEWVGLALRGTEPATVELVEGRPYWIAVLAPKGRGTVAFRDHLDAGGTASETSKQTALIALPQSWKTGQTFTSGPISAVIS